MDRLKQKWRDLNPGQMALVGFASIILLGSLVLMLPVSTNGENLGFLDALFTATSAVCVTGLIVVDTGSKFTPFGQAAILVLIQAGGFGFMMMGSFFLLMLRRKAPIGMREGAGASYLRLHDYSLGRLVAASVLVTIAIESAGAVLMMSHWAGEMSLGEALWQSVFHSVSAFCNAGFSLFPDSLASRRSDPFVSYGLMAMIVLGGLGFFVMVDIWDTVGRDPNPVRRGLSFHTKIVLAVSAWLLFSTTLLIYFIEREHSLAGMAGGQAFTQALFQAVTSRTAGFNMLDIGQLSNASLCVVMFNMLIGGAPGSMAGGLKVTTLGIVFIVVISRLRRWSTPSMFGRSINRENMEKAVTLILIAAALIAVAVIALLVTELGGTPHPESRGMFIEYLFECISAFGTVGLSTGVTPGLSAPGKLIIIALMFTGRLGPLTLMFALERRKPPASYRYPEERILIG